MSLKNCLELLATKGSNIDKFKNAHGETLLHTVAESGNLELATVLLDTKPDMNMKCEEGSTPLFVAAEHGHLGMVALLVKYGAAVYPNIYALHGAANAGHADVVKFLLENGADATEEDNHADTPARRCVAGGGCANEHGEALLAIIRAGGDIHEIGNGGNSLLHTAADNNTVACLQVLVDNGLDVNVKADDQFQDTPVNGACVYGHILTLLELHRLGADLDATDAYGRSPLMSAVRCSHYDCITAMIGLGASVELKEKWGFASIHWAAAAGDMKAVYLLLEGGAPVDALSNDRYSPLMVCMQPDLLASAQDFQVSAGSKESRTKVANLLIEMGADVDDKVMMCAMGGGLAQALVEIIRTLREQSSITIGSLTAINRKLVEHGEEVTFVKLVDKNGVEESTGVYKLNTQLVRYLAEQRGRGKALDTSNVLSNLLDPGKRGFKEGVGAVVPTAKAANEVVLTCDGIGFTKEGFGVVVEYLTTGCVSVSLVHKNRVGDAGEDEGSGTTDSAGGGGSNIEGGDGGSGGGGSGGSCSSSVGQKRKRICNDTGDSSKKGSSRAGEQPASKRRKRCLFDGVLAGKALQAADYFCLEGVTKEVKRLLDIYGFELDGDTAEVIMS